MAILSTKLRNAVRMYSRDMDLEFHLKTTVRNGYKVGCWGFIKNKGNGAIIYVNTESSFLPYLGYLYRYADNFKDYRGHRNMYAKTLEEYAEGISRCLRKTPQAVGDIRF